MVRTKHDCGCILHERRCDDHKNLSDEAVEEENLREQILLQHIADNTRLGAQTERGRKLRNDINHHIFFIPNPVAGEPRILHISFCETLTKNEKQLVNNKFQGLVVTH